MKTLTITSVFACLALGGCTTSASTQDTTSAAAVTTNALDWNAAVPDGIATPRPVRVSTHFPVTLSYFARSDGRTLYKSPDFVEGKPQPRPVIDGTLHCFVMGSREGTFRGTGPYAVTGTYVTTSVFNTFTALHVALRLSSNDEGLEDVSCNKFVRGQDPNAHITWNDIRRSLANASTGAYVVIEEAPADTQASAAATPDQIEGNVAAVDKAETDAAAAGDGATL